MHFLIIAMLALMLSTAVMAQNLEKGWEAAEHGNYAAALRLWKPLAKQGNVGAQNALGAMYYGGLGVRQDYAEAMKWWGEAVKS